MLWCLEWVGSSDFRRRRERWYLLIRNQPSTSRSPTAGAGGQQLGGAMRSGRCWRPSHRLRQAGGSRRQLPAHGRRALLPLPRELLAEAGAFAPGHEPPSSTAGAPTPRPLPPSRLSATEGRKSTNSRGNRKSLPRGESSSAVQFTLRGSPWELAQGGTPAQTPSCQHHTALSSSLTLVLRALPP